MHQDSKWRRYAPYVVAVLLIVCLRGIGLGVYPPIEADEGGWPLSVRQWVETGVQTRDYYMAPGYHWILGVPFRLFGASHSVGRPVAVLVSLLGLWLFYCLARRQGGATIGFWAVLLLGTSYPAVLIDRRDFMEPFQLALMFGLCLAATGPGDSARRFAMVAGWTCLLLLTKASALFLLPALVLSTFLGDRGTTGSQWPRRLRLTAALGGGVALACGVFYWLYLQDPRTFLQGWVADMSQVNVPDAGPSDSGRFRISPVSIERTIRWYAEHEPFLFGLALLGFLKAVWDRRHSVMAAWLALGAIHFFLQVYIQTNHRTLLMPPLCYLAAVLLCELDGAHGVGSGRAAPSFTWARAALVLIVAYGSARVLGGLATAKVPDGEAVRWLAARVDSHSTVIAAPYVLMRLRAQPVSFFRLGEPFLPTPEQVRQLRADWLLTETREWEHHSSLSSGGSLRPLENALGECCELAFRTPGAAVYRVKTGAAAARAAQRQAEMASGR